MDIRLFYEFIEITPRQILIEGCIKGQSQQLEDAKLFLKIRDANISLETFLAMPLEKEYFGFRFCIKRDRLPEKADLQVGCHLQNTDIIFKQILFGKFFPLAISFRTAIFMKVGFC